MPLLTASIEVDEGRAAALRQFAGYYKRKLQDVLDDALAAGLSEFGDPLPSGRDDPCEAFEPFRPPESLMPELTAEFDALHHGVLVPLINKTQGMPDEAAEGETVRMTIMLPREWAILAAWLEIKGRMRRNGDLSPIGNAITLDTRLAHWHKAKAYVLRELHNHFHEELHVLATHHHPYLYRPEPEAAKPQRADCESLDDGLPF